MIISSRQAYDRQLRTVRSLDLDDLLVLTAQLLEDDPNVQERCRAAYDELLIDEYQDTNPVQQRLVELLTPHARTVMAVGDPDQAIYGWRLADSRAAERFLAAYPDAAVIRLETSYRSTKRILRAASTLIQHNSGRLAGEIRTENDAGEKPECFVADDEREEAGWISTEIERLLEQGVPAKDIAVLYRVNAQSRSIEDALIQRGITYRVVGGRRFYDRPEIQQAVCFLRVVGGPDEDAAALLARSEAGVGERRLERMREYARREGMPLLDTFERSIPGVPGSVSSRLASVAASAQALRARRSAQLLQLVDAALDLVSARAASGTGIEQEALEENLAEFRSLVVEMGPRTTLPDLLARVSLADAESGHSGVSLMTLHAAKGLEFGTVFITGVEEGLLPHRRSADRTVDLEEERRLCYVGMTRAKQRLYLSYAHARILGGRALVAEPSRFIKEIGSHNLRITLSAGRRAKSRLVAVEVGDRVMHPRWNVGVVTRVEGAGRETLVTVLFQSGERRIQLCHAPLTRLEGTKRDDLAG
jgi:DNA helicase-2/ATP-dependent DNA helicase PcrA